MDGHQLDGAVARALLVHSCLSVPWDPAWGSKTVSTQIFFPSAGVNTYWGDLKSNSELQGSTEETDIFFFSELLRGLVSKVQASRCAENCFKTKETVGGMHMPEIIAPMRETGPFFSRSSCWCICRQVVVRSVEQRNFSRKALTRRGEVQSLRWMRFSRKLGWWAESWTDIVRI